MAQLPFQDRVALVTGATSGIGRATALHLARSGARVALVGRREERLREIAGMIGASGEALCVAADVATEDGASRVIGQTVAHFGGLDVLVNAAGILVAGSVENTSLAAWDETMNVNVRAIFHLTQLAAP